MREMSNQCCAAGLSADNPTCIFANYPVDPTYDTNGQGTWSAVPVPELDTKLVGTLHRCGIPGTNQKLTNPDEVDCLTGQVGLIPYEDQLKFLRNKDENIGPNGLRTVKVLSNGGLIDPESTTTANICKAGRTTPLTIDFGKLTSLTDGELFSALHKQWGGCRGHGCGGDNSCCTNPDPAKVPYRINGGCVKENVTLSDDEVTVTLAAPWCTTGNSCTPGAEKTWKQKVLNLQVNGSQYTGPIKGVLQEHAQPGQHCPTNVPTVDGAKVGGCIATTDMLGPGRYEVIAMAPDDAPVDTLTNIRPPPGYCFAIWTFHYEEHYDDQDPQKVSAANNKGKYTAAGGQCFNTQECQEGFTSTCNTPLSIPNPCYAAKSACDNGLTVVNHEIDIEIPGSWPGKLSTSNNQDVWTTDTMNCNTFLGANESDYPRGNWSSQYIAKKMPPTGSTQQQSFLSTDGLFHKYAIDWVVPTDTSQAPYVSWYFDDALVHTSYTMVPSRAGRLVVGGWFPHWVQSGKSEDPSSLQALFNYKTIQVASITFTPDPNSAPGNYPQNYDQCGTSPIACGFAVPDPTDTDPVEDIRICKCTDPGGNPPAPPGPSVKDWWHNISKTEKIVLAVASGVLILTIIGIGIYSLSKKKVAVVNS